MATIQLTRETTYVEESRDEINHLIENENTFLYLNEIIEKHEMKGTIRISKDSGIRKPISINVDHIIKYE